MNGSEPELPFGATLRRLRREANLSQEELAERAGLSAKAISALERGERRHPYRSTLALIADALKLGTERRSSLIRSAARPGSAARASPLPPRTVLFGRDSDLENVGTLIARSRVVTVVGTGGVGKTQLALAFAERARDAFPDGVVSIHLAPLREGRLLDGALATALNLAESSARDRLATVLHALMPRQALLVFDNCEHLIDDSARIVGTIVDACPHVFVLATSREPLAIGREAVYRLPSLPLPEPQRIASLAAGDASEFAAIELFVRRANAANPAFVLTDANAPVVGEICLRLDGIPLAIELAAARTGILAPRELLARLDERFTVLTDGRRDVPPRHQTMRATFDWSFELLDGLERTVLRRASVFAGGWTLAAAEAVCADESLDRADVLSALAGLVAKSLVTADASGSAARYGLLESMRAYAAEALDAAGERDAVMRRFVAWVDAFARDAYDANWRTPLARWLSTVARELDNVRTALAWCLNGPSDAERGRRIAGNLIGLWFHREREGRQWCERALATADAHTDVREVARLCSVLALLTVGRKSIEYAQRAVAAFATFDDSFDIAWSYRQLAMSRLQTGAVPEALAAIEQSIALFEACDMTDGWPYAAALGLRATMLTSLGRHDEARSVFTESIARFDGLGDDRRADMHRINLSKLECATGNISGALALTTAAAPSFERSFDLGRAALAQTSAGTYQLMLGDIDAAARSASRGLALASESYFSQAIASAIGLIASIAVQWGDVGPAARLVGYLDAWYAGVGQRAS